MYSLIRTILFALDPERAHRITLSLLKLAHQLRLTRLFKKIPNNPCTLMGLTFPNRVGLAAGFDINAEYLNALQTLGFGFIEIGGVTPNPQEGNPKPRIFRLTKQQGIINRKGFANKGVDYVAAQLQQANYQGILGINLTKNRITTNDNAVNDYVTSFRKLWKYASYITLNISSPNTPGLRDLQKTDLLNPLLSAMKEEQSHIKQTHQKYIPLVVKISPDVTEAELKELADIFLKHQIDGIIATNTTVSRQQVEDSPLATETGGLSGKPLQQRSTHIIQQLKTLTNNQIPLIASGGVMDEASAREKLQAGASLLQIYSGLIYTGPRLIAQLAAL